MSNHISVMPYVCRNVDGPRPVGKGKRRAWCDKCGELKDKNSFYAKQMWPHPSRSFAMYYEPHWSWMCKECHEKDTTPSMEEEEYNRLFDEMLKASFA